MPHSQPATSPVAAELAGVLPERHERVLQDVDDDLRVVAPAHEPGVEPGRVPVVQLPERHAVTAGDRATSSASSWSTAAAPMPSLSHRKARKVPVRSDQNLSALPEAADWASVLLMQVTMPARSAAATARRAQILDATIDVIAQEGFARASFARICERAGLSSTRLISYHFAGKAELVAALVEHVIAGIGEHVGARVMAAETPGARLGAYIDGVVGYADTHRAPMSALLQVVTSGAWGDGAAGAERREPPREDPCRRSACRRDAAVRHPRHGQHDPAGRRGGALPAGGRTRPRLHGVRRRAGGALRPRDEGGSMTLRTAARSASWGRRRSTT